jgi:hypothetical protein
MPDVDFRAGKRRASRGADPGDPEGEAQRCPWLHRAGARVGAQIRSLQVALDKKRALGLLRANDARRKRTVRCRRCVPHREQRGTRCTEYRQRPAPGE